MRTMPRLVKDPESVNRPGFEVGIDPSVGSKGDSYDNALAETINNFPGRPFRPDSHQGVSTNSGAVHLQNTVSG